MKQNYYTKLSNSVSLKSCLQTTEEAYYKLWLSSINILNSVLQNAIESRTKYFLSQLELKIRYYVITKKIDEANKILKSEKILLVTGQPGIGKTSLAEIILFQRAKDGFKIYKVENIKDAEDVISIDDNESQIFYFDDFLGANYSEIINSHKTETQLTNFVERIKNTPNKYIVLTTRTVILNYATEQYEKISHSSLNNRKFELKLNDYSKYEKALILYNHFFHKGIDERFYDVLLREKFYNAIIRHKNYTPRIIEFITDKSKIKDFNADEYHQFILNNLNNPKEIWRYSFANQIQSLDRCLLLTLFSFGNEVNERELEIAYEARIIFEKDEHNQIIKSNQFDHSISILMNGFISSILYNFNRSSHRNYSFLNPSLADFIINYVADSLSERKSIISSIISTKQLNRFKPKESKIPLEKELQLIIRDKIENNEFSSLPSTKNDDNAEILSVLTTYCKDVNTDRLLYSFLEKIDFSIDWNYNIHSKVIKTLEELEDSPTTFVYIKSNFTVIIEKIIKGIDDSMFIEDIEILFKKFGEDYEAYSESKSGKKHLEDLARNIILLSENELKENIKNEALDFDAVTEIYSELSDIKTAVFEQLTVSKDVRNELDFTIDRDYWDEIFEENLERKQMRELEEYEYEESLDDELPQEESEDDKIERLFE